MFKFLIIFLTIFLSGCQSYKNLPSGKWKSINQDGFIPTNVKKYKYDTRSLEKKSRDEI